MKIQLSLISKYRAELMGLATLGILVCHCPANGVMMPQSLKYLMYCGKIGVALFMFLSGFGLYYSLSKNRDSLINWYKKRYIRILVPYLLISLFPGFVFALFSPDTDWLRYFARLSLVSYWKYHDCAWFLAVLLPLYAISPLFFRIINHSERVAVTSLLLMVPFMLLPMLQIGNVVFDTICYESTHCVVFISGMVAAYYAMREQTINVWLFLAMGVICCILFFLQYRNFSSWYNGLFFASMPYVLYLFNNKLNKWMGGIFIFLGSISLESYLTNTLLPGWINRIPWNLLPVDINYGNYLSYGIVILGGLAWAWLIHRLSRPIISKLTC